MRGVAARDEGKRRKELAIGYKSTWNESRIWGIFFVGLGTKKGRADLWEGIEEEEWGYFGLLYD